MTSWGWEAYDAAAEPGGPTPLSLAQVMHAAGHAPAGSAKRLILEAARPRNIDNHRLYPDDARAPASQMRSVRSYEPETKWVPVGE